MPVCEDSLPVRDRSWFSSLRQLGCLCRRGKRADPGARRGKRISEWVSSTPRSAVSTAAKRKGQGGREGHCQCDVVLLGLSEGPRRCLDTPQVPGWHRPGFKPNSPLLPGSPKALPQPSSGPSPPLSGSSFYPLIVLQLALQLLLFLLQPLFHLPLPGSRVHRFGPPKDGGSPAGLGRRGRRGLLLLGRTPGLQVQLRPLGGTWEGAETPRVSTDPSPSCSQRGSHPNKAVTSVLAAEIIPAVIVPGVPPIHPVIPPVVAVFVAVTTASVVVVPAIPAAKGPPAAAYPGIVACRSKGNPSR